jgi:hypothetical protein
LQAFHQLGIHNKCGVDDVDVAQSLLEQIVVTIVIIVVPHLFEGTSSIFPSVKDICANSFTMVWACVSEGILALPT